MELSQQVVNLELSKRLKELGVKQESLFQWIEEFDNEFKIYPSSPHFPHPDWRHINTIDYYSYSAFTASELLEMLPSEIKNGERTPFGLVVEKYCDIYKVFYNTILKNDRHDELYETISKNNLSDSF